MSEYNETNPYSTLSNADIALIYFRYLNANYSAEGVNLGRSLKSKLVDGYLGLHLDPTKQLLALIDIRLLIDEVKSRKPYTHKQSVLGGIDHLGLISSMDMGSLCIEALCAWHKIHQHETDRDGVIVNYYERIWTEVVKKIIPIPYFPYIKSDEDIRKIAIEADQRVVIRLIPPMSTW